MELPGNSEPPWKAVEHGKRWIVIDANSSTVCTCILKEDAELIALLPRFYEVCDQLVQTSVLKLEGREAELIPVMAIAANAARAVGAAKVLAKGGAT